MNPAQARKWLVISALVTAGVWGYRRFREGPQSITAFPEFITGWGAVYFILAMITEAAPRFGGAFSILIMTGDLLHNANPAGGAGLLSDLTSQLGQHQTSPSPKISGSVAKVPTQTPGTARLSMPVPGVVKVAGA